VFILYYWDFHRGIEAKISGRPACTSRLNPRPSKRVAEVAGLLDRCVSSHKTCATRLCFLRQTWIISYFNTCTVHLLFCCTMTNNCTFNWQIITLLLHVSTLSLHPQGARHIRYIAFIHPLVKPVFLTDCIYSHHTEGLHENYNTKIILVHFIINRTILIFQRF
jgi:hypothetical protein